MPPSVSSYARLALSVLFKHGLGTLLAIFLVWKLAEGYERKLEATAVKIDQMAAAQAAHAADTKRQIDLLRAICLGVNTTEASRAMCEVSR
jgi:hypothetical protein